MFDWYRDRKYLHKLFSANISLLCPLKTEGFLMFSGGIEVEHWLKID